MRRKTALILAGALILGGNCFSLAQNVNEPSPTRPVELVRFNKEFSSVSIEPVRVGTRPGIAVIFDGTDDMHYYANKETAPAAGTELGIEARSEQVAFGKAVFPKWSILHDSIGTDTDVYVGQFTVFIPVIGTLSDGEGHVEVKISGVACTSMVCLPPFEKAVTTKLDLGGSDSWRQITIEKAPVTGGAVLKSPSYPVWFAFGLAFVAGLIFNIMPCIWPVLPLIVMRIVEQAKAGRRQSATMGLAFCSGILAFFACFAAVNAVLRLFYATVLQLGDPFRNDVFVILLGLLLVVMALFMFDLFAIRLPSSVSNKAGSGKGYAGAVGMGFLAAILSTPCSFGILGAAFVWAQTQPLWLATITIMIIGVGMALPYAILTSIPALVNRLPKAGRWMELFKQGVGFILLAVAVWLIGTRPPALAMRVVFFAVVIGFCFWMWGSWVGYATAPVRKWIVRAAALLLAVVAGLGLLTPTREIINWQNYDAALIQDALENDQPVLLKFTAEWCLSCKVIDRTVFGKQDIAELMEQKRVLAVKADTTGKPPEYPATHALKNLYNEPGVPVTILLLPDGQDKRWHGKFFADELRETLEELPSK